MTQTDWSTGGGVPGPVTDWGSAFNVSTSVSWLEFPGEIHLSSIPIAPAGHTLTSGFSMALAVYAADLDGDGDMDVLGAAGGNPYFTWWENTDGSGTSWETHTIGGSCGGPRSVYAADMDGDGDMDALGAASSSDDIIWWDNADGSGTSWVTHIVEGDFDNPYSVHAADVDGDGDLDILGAAADAGDITWWENSDGSGTIWVTHTIDGNYNFAHSVRAADLDGDGDEDVLGTGSAGITWWENTDGSGTIWIEHTLDGSVGTARSASAADMDFDGDLDVLGAHDYGFAWWENSDGSGTGWVKHVVDVVFNTGQSVDAADMDGDDDLDLLGACWDHGFAWWENTDGTGTSWATHTTDGHPHAIFVHAADVDGDGDADFLGANPWGNWIGWWEVTEYLGSGHLTGSILDAGQAADWGQVGWTESLPAYTDLSMRLRAGSDPGSMGSWVLVDNPGDQIPSFFDGMRYLQYRVDLDSDTDASPCMTDITVDWTPYTGIESEGVVCPGCLLLGACPNPVTGAAQIGYSVPAMTRVDLTVFDLSGRIVAGMSIDSGEGTHSYFVGELAAGIYVVRMRAGEFEAAERFVVIR